MNLTALTNFKKLLNAWVTIPEEEWTRVLPLLRSRKMSKGDFYNHQGEECLSGFFVHSGLFELFYTTTEGKELICRFSPENDFAAAYIGLLTDQKAECSIRALEDSEIVDIDYRRWRKDFLRSHICWEIIARNVAEGEFIVRATRERLFLVSDAKERYMAFQRTFPQLKLRVPQHKIASYLGINPVSLSRLNRILKT